MEKNKSLVGKYVETSEYFAGEILNFSGVVLKEYKNEDGKEFLELTKGYTVAKKNVCLVKEINNENVKKAIESLQVLYEIYNNPKLFDIYCYRSNDMYLDDIIDAIEKVLIKCDEPERRRVI